MGPRAVLPATLWTRPTLWFSAALFQAPLFQIQPKQVQREPNVAAGFVDSQEALYMAPRLGDPIYDVRSQREAAVDAELPEMVKLGLSHYPTAPKSCF
jgi:hypothetical protein